MSGLSENDREGLTVAVGSHDPHQQANVRHAVERIVAARVAAARADERERLIARLRGLASTLAQPTDTKTAEYVWTRNDRADHDAGHPSGYDCDGYAILPPGEACGRVYPAAQPADTEGPTS